jgi:hypothetical protein
MVRLLNGGTDRVREHSIGHLKCRVILWPSSAVIVDARGADICMTKPFLHLRDIGLMVERVGCRAVRRSVFRLRGAGPPG